MNICPGCGRCRDCGQPAPITPVYPQTHPWLQPTIPTTPNPWTAPYYVGDPIPGALGTLTVTC